MSSAEVGAFGVEIGIDSGGPVVEVRGEVDLATAPMLGALLDVLVDHAETHVVLDLAELTFMDASGLQVIADVSGRLAPSRRVLVVQSASPIVRQLLAITGVDDLVLVATAEPARQELAPEQEEPTRSQPDEATSAATDVVVDLIERSALPATRDTVDAALKLVVSLAAVSVGGADGVSVSLERDGAMRTVASSDHTVLEMDHDQYETGEGPCLSAAADGRWFHVQALAEETRWPQFAPRALERGINSILSSPLMANERSIGALNIYSRSEHAFGVDEQELAELFATHASGILADAGVGRSTGPPNERLQRALESREVIAQAQGILMERSGISVDEASTQLHRAARASEITVGDHAARIVTSARRGPRPSE